MSEQCPQCEGLGLIRGPNRELSHECYRCNGNGIVIRMTRGTRQLFRRRRRR